jgi:hypothetical protein
MGRVTDLVQRGDQLVEPVLPEADTQVQDMTWLGVTVQFPTSGYFRPGMFRPHFAPWLERFGEAEMNESQKKSGRQSHLPVRKQGASLTGSAGQPPEPSAWLWH